MPYNITLGGRQVLRASTVALSNSYDSAPTEIKVQGTNQVLLLCELVLSTATSVEVSVEVANPAPTAGAVADPAPVSGDWHPLAFIDIGSAAGTGITKQIPVRQREYQLAASGKYAIELPISAKWMRVKAKTTGTTGSATLVIIGQQGMA